MPTRTIWKFELSSVGVVSVDMPRGAKVLHVGGQRWKVCLWAEVDATAEKELRVFAVVGTGHHYKPEDGQSWQYVGTAQMHDGLVWHVLQFVEDVTAASLSQTQGAE